MTRLRQVVLAASELPSVSEKIEEEIGCRDGYHDPDVIAFGLENVVYAIGDTFLEVVVPVRENTTAGRLIERSGEGGYMAIFQTDDLASARKRVDDLGIRVVWQAELDDIAAMHLHPKDIGGAIVSVDQADPPGSWRWAGPSWTGDDLPAGRGGVRSITIRVTDPREVAERWAAVLGEPVHNGTELQLNDGQQVRFVPVDGQREGIADVVVARPDVEPSDVTIAGVCFSIRRD